MKKNNNENRKQSMYSLQGSNKLGNSLQKGQRQTAFIVNDMQFDKLKLLKNQQHTNDCNDASSYQGSSVIG
jgi:hypothetical protein